MTVTVLISIFQAMAAAVSMVTEVATMLMVAIAMVT